MACEDNTVDVKMDVKKSTHTHDIGDAPLVVVGFHFNK